MQRLHSSFQRNQFISGFVFAITITTMTTSFAAEPTLANNEYRLVTPSALSSLTPPFAIVALENKSVLGEDAVRETRINLSSPLLMTKSDYIAASMNATQTHLGRTYSLGDASVVPADLGRAETGMQYSRRYDGQKNWGLRVSVGYAGDKLYQKINDTVFNVIATHGYPNATGQFWIWSIFISNNTPFGNYLPIPGLMYILRTPTFSGIVGFPTTSLQWTPIPEQTYSFSLLGLNVTTEAAFGEIHSLQYFSNIKWASQSFLLSQRKDEKDRLTLEEKKVGLGLRSFLFGHLQAEAETGYAFDRILFSGSGLRNMRSGSFHLQDNWYISASLKAGF